MIEDFLYAFSVFPVTVCFAMAIPDIWKMPVRLSERVMIIAALLIAYIDIAKDAKPHVMALIGGAI